MNGSRNSSAKKPSANAKSPVEKIKKTESSISKEKVGQSSQDLEQ